MASRSFWLVSLSKEILFSREIFQKICRWSLWSAIALRHNRHTSAPLSLSLSKHEFKVYLCTKYNQALIVNLS